MEDIARIIGYLVISAVMLSIPILCVVSWIYWNPAITFPLSVVVIIEWFSMAMSLERG